MKTKFKLIAFLICNFSFLISTNGQIVYTDVPDQTFNTNNAYYNLDLNNDGINDFQIVVVSHFFGTLCCKTCGVSGYDYEVKMQPLNGDSILYLGAANMAKVLSTNMPIINSSAWSNLNTDFLARNLKSGHWPDCPGIAIIDGNWNSATDKYLGLKLNANGNTYLGWARLNVSVTSSSSSFTIKDYSYNTIPDQPILAGETSCAIPTVTISKSGSLSFCTGDSVTFTANGTGYLYQWKKNGVNISGATSQTYIAKTAGIYKCKVINSCGSKTSGGKTVTVPCKDASFLSMTTDELEHLLVFPNPATNMVTVKIPSDEVGEISIINLFGGRVFSEKVNTEEFQIDVRKFSAGMYVVRWSSGDNFEIKKFSVER